MRGRPGDGVGVARAGGARCVGPVGVRGAVRVASADPRAPDRPALPGAHAALMHALFPAESNHALDAEGLAAPDVRFLAARGADERVLAVRRDHGEVEAMHVAHGARGLRLGRRPLAEVEAPACREGLPRLMLETGDGLAEVCGLYGRPGFTDRGPFGPHRDGPRSVPVERAP